MRQKLNDGRTEEVWLENFSIKHTACWAICEFACDFIQCSFLFCSPFRHPALKKGITLQVIKKKENTTICLLIFLFHLAVVL